MFHNEKSRCTPLSGFLFVRRQILLFPSYFSLSPCKFSLSYKMFFVTNFVTRITKFVTCVRKFVTAVTKFVTNFFKQIVKIICLIVKNISVKAKSFTEIFSLKGEWGHVLGRSAFQAHRPHNAFPGTSYPVTVATLRTDFQADSKQNSKVT